MHAVRLRCRHVADGKYAGIKILDPVGKKIPIAQEVVAVGMRIDNDQLGVGDSSNRIEYRGSLPGTGPVSISTALRLPTTSPLFTAKPGLAIRQHPSGRASMPGNQAPHRPRLAFP